MITQEQLIKGHLITYGTITSIEAISKYGVTRLAHYIHLFRRDGMNISTLNVTGKNRYGNKVVYAKYKLEDDK